MPKKRWILLALLLLALPVLWWGLSTPSEAPTAPGPSAQAAARPGSSPASPAPQALGTPDAEEPEDGEPPAEDTVDAEQLEAELAGPGPCIQVEVTARGAPIANARVGAVHLEAEDIYYELSPLPVGPEGRRKAWCRTGEYRLVAMAPGFAASFVKLTVKEGGATPVARFELTTGHSVSGRVLDKDSEQPLSGAKLSIQSLDDDFSIIVPELSATSDARGLFRIDTLAEGTYQIEAKAPGHTENSLEVEVPSPQPLNIELEGTSRIEGQVVDGSGAPVAGAKVQAGSSGHLDEESAELSDAQGRFSLEVNEGTYLLAASTSSLSGVLEGRVSVARGGLVDGLVIRLRPTGRLTGRVVLKSNQEPIKGAFLSIRHDDSGWAHSTQTKEDGTFSAEGLLPGLYGVVLYKTGFPDTRREDVHIEPGQQATVEFALIREASLEGTLTDGLGHPAEESLLLATLVQEPQDGPRMFHGSADESGHYRIGGLPPGTYHLEARLSSDSPPATRELTLQEGETARADFVLQDALGTVEGTVRRASGGPPVYDVTIEARSEQVSNSEGDVDEQGHFTLKLTPGEYTFAATYSDTQDDGLERRVRVEAGKLVRVTLTVPDKVAETSGVVLNARGEPVPEADVSLEDGDELSSQTSTDSQGRFTLVSSHRTVGKTVTVSAENGAEKGALQNVSVGSRNVVVRLQKAAALRGRLVTTQGAPVQGFELRVFALGEDKSWELLDTRPFAGDTFEWVDLPIGTVELRARTTDGRSGKVNAQLASGRTTTAELPVGTLASVTGRIVNGSGAPLMQRVSVDAETPDEQQLYPGRDGRFEIIALDPGQHRIAIGTTQHFLVELREGETLELGTVRVGSGPR